MAELPHIGKRCMFIECQQLDFLPITCDACEKAFCSQHISYDLHNCLSEKDIRVPICPKCQKPVAIDRDKSMEQIITEHIERNCQSDPNKRRIYGYRCSINDCKKKEIIPFACNMCLQNFCLKHRYEFDHDCRGKATDIDNQKSQSEKLLSIEATKYGYRLLNAPGDGNCFYHSIAFQLKRLLGIGYTADELRKEVDAYKKEHRQEYAAFQVSGEYDQWADHIDIVVTSLIYNIDLVIVRSDAAEPTIFIQKNESAIFVVLGYEVGLHYRPMIRDERIERNVDLIEIIQTSKHFNHRIQTETLNNQKAKKSTLNIVSKSIRTFDQYYPNVFAKKSNKTLIIPSSNDLVDDNYLHRKFDPDDNLSRSKTGEHKAEKALRLAEIKQLKDQLLYAEETNKERMKSELIALENEMARSDQPWNLSGYTQKHRERETITKVINAFRNADIGGILILSPKQNKELENFIKRECRKYPELKDFPKEFKQYQEICDCIYFHETLGIYIIEVKATNELKPMSIEERKGVRKKEIENNPYEKAVFQLSRMLNTKESMSLLEKLYAIITGSRDIPNISGIVCTPNAKSSETENKDNLDQRFHHFDSDLLSSIDRFEQFWAIEMSIYHSIETKNLFTDSNYRKFISTMAYCSVGRELFGIKNALKIAQKIISHEYDPTIMEKRELNKKETIFLNEKQMEILNDKSKYKFVYGPPGTGKTILVILAAIDAANEMKNEGKVIVFTREFLVNYMKIIFEFNGFDENVIEVGDFEVGVEELNENDYIFVDECTADENQIKNWLCIAKKTGNGKLFVAISGQNDIEELCIIEQIIMEVFKDEADYRIFQLTEILRGTKSIIEFWMNRLNKILPKELKMECGHSIIGENVHCCWYLKSEEMLEKMMEKVKELLINNEPKNIAIICADNGEKELIENKLKYERIAFGSTIEHDKDGTLIAVESTNNIYSREWPFVIYVSLFPYRFNQYSIIESSRAIAHLTFIERNEKGIHKIIRDKCNDNNEIMKSILSSFAEYNRFRNEIELSDDSDIIYEDLLIEIIINNHFPSQIAQLFPIFSVCNTFDEFFNNIINEEQWMLLLYVRQWGYFEELRHWDKSIQLTLEYRQSRESIEIEENRQIRLNKNLKSTIELINKYIHIKDKMEKIVIENQNLFEILNNSNGKKQFDLIGHSIGRIVMRSSIRLQVEREINLNMTEIDEQIHKLLFHLNQLANRYQQSVVIANKFSEMTTMISSFIPLLNEANIYGYRPIEIEGNDDCLRESIFLQIKRTLSSMCDIDELNEYVEILNNLFESFNGNDEFAYSNARLMAISQLFVFDIVVLRSDGWTLVIRRQNALARLFLGYAVEFDRYYVMMKDESSMAPMSLNKHVENSEYANV